MTSSNLSFITAKSWNKLLQTKVLKNEYEGSIYETSIQIVS